MNHKSPTTSTTPFGTLAAISAALFSMTLLMACSGGPQAALPLAPSALPSSMLALETGHGGDAWNTLGKKGRDGRNEGGNDRDRGKDKGDQDDAGSDVPDGTTTVRIEGVVSTVTGTCPAVTFVVGLHTVVTNAATKFDEGLCAQLIPLAAVEIRAVRQTDGTLLAKDVEFEDDDADDGTEDVDDDEAEHEDGEGNPHHGEGPHDGTVSSFRGVCPTVTFNLRGMTIVADAATTYVGGTCGTLRPNVQVVVTGAFAPAARRTFNAATITITRTH